MYTLQQKNILVPCGSKCKFKDVKHKNSRACVHFLVDLLHIKSPKYPFPIYKQTYCTDYQVREESIYLLLNT